MISLFLTLSLSVHLTAGKSILSTFKHKISENLCEIKGHVSIHSNYLAATTDLQVAKSFNNRFCGKTATYLHTTTSQYMSVYVTSLPS